jgi:hypothetical protein
MLHDLTAVTDKLIGWSARRRSITRAASDFATRTAPLTRPTVRGVWPPISSAWRVHIASVLDAKDDYLVSVVAQSIQHPIGSAPRGPHSGELAAQWFADAARIRDQRGNGSAVAMATIAAH